MERKQAIFAATAAAVTMVTGSFAYAATRLIATPGDNVGKLAATATAPAPTPPREVQYVYETLPSDGAAPSASAPMAPPDAEGFAPLAAASAPDGSNPTAAFDDSPAAPEYEDEDPGYEDSGAYEDSEDHEDVEDSEDSGDSEDSEDHESEPDDD